MTEDSTGVQLRTAIVVSTTEDVATVVTRDGLADVPYALPFPRPRAERVTPGHLVAVAAAPVGHGVVGDVVVWRWYDAVVLSAPAGQVRLWEPFHGTVTATPRDPQRPRPVGSRVYLSAGLPGAQWWVAGPAVAHAEDAEVELDEVGRFFTDNGLWDGLA